MIEEKEDIRKQVTEFLKANTGEDHIDENENIFESGLVNSLFAIELMTFIEQCFGIKVTIQDLSIERFSSISNIHGFVQEKLAAG